MAELDSAAADAHLLTVDEHVQVTPRHRGPRGMPAPRAKARAPWRAVPRVATFEVATTSSAAAGGTRLAGRDRASRFDGPPAGAPGRRRAEPSW